MIQGSLTQRFFEIGCCIYCSKASEPLTKEHAVPFALAGDAIVLKAACCEQCRVVTSKCERNPIHENWAEVRAALDFPSRKRKLAHETFSLDVELEDGSRTILRLKGSETLGLVQFLEYDPPAFFNPSGYTSGVKVTGARLIGFGVNPEDFKKKHSIKRFHLTTRTACTDFEKMITKMAYCLVIAFWGMDCLEERYVLPTILNEKDDVGYWMGCDSEGRITPAIGKPPGDFAPQLTVLITNSGERIVVVRLKFFPASDAPEYIVVVGSLKATFTPPD